MEILDPIAMENAINAIPGVGLLACLLTVARTLR